VDTLAEKDQQTFQDLMEACEATTEVTAAREAHEAASARVSKLHAAHGAMNRRGGDLHEAVVAAKDALEGGLIEQYAESGRPVDASALFTKYAVAQGERDALMRALSRLAEHATPLAEIADLRAEAAVFKARAEHLKRVAEERIQKTAELMREAAEFESGLVMDTRSTLTGQLFAFAETLAGRSVQAACTANDRQFTYNRMYAPVLR
jgi:hypothetical protein